MRDTRGRITAAAVLWVAVAQLVGCMPGSRIGAADSSVANADPTAQPAVAQEASAPAPAQPALAQTIETITTAGPHDNLYSVARAHNVPIRDLIQWNGLDPPYDLKPGQVLRLPPRREHVVAANETLYSISRRYGVDMTTLARNNAIEPPYNIAVGRHLQLPAPTVVAADASGRSPAAVSAQPNSAAPAAVPAAAPAPLPPPASTAPTAVPTSASIYPAVEEVPLAPLPSASQAGDMKPANAAPTPRRDATEEAAANAAVPPIAPEPKSQIQTAALPEVLPEPRPDAAIVPPDNGESFIWPLRGKVLSAFGEKKGGEHNDGINIEAKRGEPIRAAADGTVIYAGNELRGFGNLVLIKHANGWTTAYAHNDSLSVHRGAQVKRGQVIAKAGSTGSVSSPQLHFEIRRGTHAVNPSDYLTATAEAASPVSRVVGRAVLPNLE